MKRADIISKIGRKYLKSNIENDEFSYKKGLQTIGKNYLDYLSEDAKRMYKDLDIRFENEKLSILVETKQNLNGSDLKNGLIQLQNYINFERELNNNQIVAILASTTKDEIYVWYNINDAISLENYQKNERAIKTFDEYYDIYYGTTNDKLTLIQNTYSLNELLHKYGINEKIRSQFVGTCLLALKNGLIYENLSTAQIIAGVESKLTNLLEKDLNKAYKLSILKTKVLNSQDVRDLKDSEFQDILNHVKNDILPSINDKSTMGQDLLNLFFTTFNKYVGKTDKNQAFTPDHIVHFMCKVTGVNRNSIVLDPCCGSGAFLVRALTDALDDCDTEEQRNHVKQKQIYGIEYEETAFGLSTTNMLIHGDGNSNIIQGSCFSEDNYTNAGINVVLMNPPYNGQRKHCNPKYVETWNSKVTTDPSKGFHYVYYIASKVKTGKLAVLLPMQCAIGASADLQYFKKKMLEEHTLDAVFSLPADMFYPGANAVACCMVFNLGVRHENSPIKETFFGYFKDDGFIKRKNLGRLEREPGIWNKIESKWLQLYRERKTEVGLSVVKRVGPNDEWLAEAYMETDYSKLNKYDFQKVINEYLGYRIANGGNIWQS